MCRFYAFLWLHVTFAIAISARIKATQLCPPPPSFYHVFPHPVPAREAEHAGALRSPLPASTLTHAERSHMLAVTEGAP